jgi:two-component system sensor histidine kinase VicK
MKPLKMFNRIHWKFILIYMLLVLMAMQVIGAYFNRALESHYLNEFSRNLEQQAGVLVHSIQTYLREPLNPVDTETNNEIQLFVERMVTSPHIEIQILDQNGVVISASSDKQTVIGQRNTQQEVRNALLGARDEAIRIHPNNGHRMKILTLPIYQGNEVVGALYLMASMEETYQIIKDINRIFATGTLLALLLTGVLGVAISRTITSPIKDMTDKATSMAEGDFSNQVTVYGQDEIGQLANTLNRMSERLSTALSENAEEKQKLSSILNDMSDGVIATDQQGCIILINPMAEYMLRCKEAEVLGHPLTDLVALKREKKELIKLLKEGTQFIIDVKHKDQLMILQVKVTPLMQQGDKSQGLIIVLQDITNQEKLERERKEFVANVSHELRTPLTTMKSYLEALESGVLSDPELGPRFIKVTQTETERMIRLVNDLLHLSKLDKKVRLYLQDINIKKLIEDVTERFSVQFKERQLKLKLHLQEIPHMEADRDLLIQVLDNLISNAIKYSHAKGTIFISALHSGEDVFITIRDEGIGIPKADLAHIFKRFYRVGKARSRDMGGTGLGLSIAREMIIAHHGEIRIESEPGKGTTVFIRLPEKQTHKGAQIS